LEKTFWKHLSLDVPRGRAYICGEETGLIESLEGKRAWPRIKPPFPAVEGLFHKPTIVNNVETLCCVTHILDRGVEWFKSIGVPPDPAIPHDMGSYGPKLYCVSGHVNKPCCVELPLGVTAAS
jgi:NADH-quinone oxidoreductase subunit F